MKILELLKRTKIFEGPEIIPDNDFGLINANENLKQALALLKNKNKQAIYERDEWIFPDNKFYTNPPSYKIKDIERSLYWKNLIDKLFGLKD